MKILLEKLFIKIGGWEFILLFIPFVLWVISFHAFFTGHIGLQQDAISYAYHIGIYTDNLKKGVYPLWFPQWYSGFPYHFFLRRIGDVNPLLFSIVFLKWLGVSSATSYLVFLAVYYFLAGWALYLITRFLLVDRFYAFTAYILFLFSSWGCEIFYNYIVIIYVPIIWFFYFILCFSRTAKRSCFLGAFFCVGLIATTYIPFFFVIILAVFSVLFVLFYGNVFIEFTKTLFKFCNKNKIFVFLCATFLFVSCVPAFVFYKESKAGEFVLPDRHSGADASSAIAVGLSNVASGDIVNHGFFDRIFNDHIHLDMGDIYIPYMFFLILLVATFARVNKLIFFLLFNILGISLVTITSAGGVHRFLYDHVIFFKFIRNIYYLFWLAILPMVILLSVSAFQSLLKVIDNSSKKMFWMVYVIICHLLFILFLSQQQGVLIGAWFAVGISLVFFIIYCLFEKGISYPLGFCAILLAVFIQSAQVYGFLSDRIYQIEQDSISYSQTHPSTKILRLAMYYGSSWFEVLVNFIDPTVLENYRIHPFILYDNVAPYADSPQFLKIFEQTATSNTNIAYVAKSESSPDDWKSDSTSNPQAEIDPISSGNIILLPSDVNSWKVRTHLPRAQFLVINDCYNTDWHAFINGHKAQLLRANVAFKGLWVPAGDSEIYLRFSNPARYALHIFLIFLFTGVFILLLMFLKKESRRVL